MIPQIELQRHPVTGELVPEEWRDISGHEGYYQISNYGRVRSVDRFVNGISGCRRFLKGKILAQAVNQRGYKTIVLWNKHKFHSNRTHRLVATAFISNDHFKPTVNHRNSKRTDNFVYNLEWATNKEQTDHAIKNGFNPSANMARLQIVERGIVVDASEFGFKHKDIARYFGVSRSVISNIVNKRTFVSK